MGAVLAMQPRMERAPLGWWIDPVPARALVLYVVATPLLWGSGLLIPLGGLLVLWLGIRVGYSALVARLTAAWFLVGAAQATSVVVNSIGDGRDLGFMAYRLVSSGVTGWIVLGLALSVGARYRLTTAPIVRAICILGAYFLLFGVLALLLFSFTGLREFAVRTPLALLVPSSAPSAEFSFTMRFFSSDELLGHDLPRLVLFYPWSVVLGFAGIAVFFISLLEKSMPFRIIGASGGVVAVLGCQGRAPIAAFLGLLVANALLPRLDRRAMTLFAGVALFLGGALVPFRVSPTVVAGWAYDAFSSLRPGSSMARELGYAMSIQGFLESPVLGKGWVGEHVAPGIPLPIGSHSSFYGILYTGGAVTFVVFVVALTMTLVVLARRARRGPVQRTGFVIASALALLAYGEGIYSFVLPCVPLLLFLGGTLATPGAQDGRLREVSS